jgi:hypothetical protein
MLDTIRMTQIRRSPAEFIAEFFEEHKQKLEEMVDTHALYIALDEHCKKHSLNYATVENLLRNTIEPVLDNHIFSA